VSTQYIIAIPGIGTVSVFQQNMTFGPLAGEGAEVWVSWDVDHGFGLEDEPLPEPRFPADTDTATIAVQKKRALMSELEEA
jgi:spermidine/putrescine transport system ATP-binding protein